MRGLRQILIGVQTNIKTAVKNCTSHKPLSYRRGKEEEKKVEMTIDMMIENGLFLYSNSQKQCIDSEYLDGKLCTPWKQTAFT